jgi:hypothetical protein
MARNSGEGFDGPRPALALIVTSVIAAGCGGLATENGGDASSDRGSSHVDSGPMDGREVDRVPPPPEDTGADAGHDAAPDVSREDARVDAATDAGALVPDFAWYILKGVRRPWGLAERKRKTRYDRGLPPLLSFSPSRTAVLFERRPGKVCASGVSSFVRFRADLLLVHR